MIDILNPTHPTLSLNQGRLGWWLCLPDQQSNTQWRDLMGRTDGIPTNGPSFKNLVPNRRGGFGYAGHTVSGTNQSWDCSATNFGSSATWTWAAWVYPTATVQAAGIMYSRTANTVGMIMTAGSAGLTLAWDLGGTSTFNWAFGPPFTLNAWQFVVCSTNLTGGTAYSYTEAGVLTKATNSYSAYSAQTIDGLNLSRDTYSTRAFPGYLDDLSLYNRQLTDAQVQALFDESVNGYPTTLRWLNVLPLHKNSLSGGATASVSFAGLPIITGALAAQSGAGTTLAGLPTATGSLAVTGAGTSVALTGLASATGSLAVTGVGTQVALAGLATATGTLGVQGGAKVTLAGLPVATGSLAVTSGVVAATVSFAGLPLATGSLGVQSGASVTLAGIPAISGALAATAASSAATVALTGLPLATGTLTAQSGAGVTLAGLASATGSLAVTAAGGVTGGPFDKPAPGSAINHAHPLAPRSATAVVFALLDHTATTVVDDYQGKLFTRTGTDGGPNWTSAAFPGSTLTNYALDLQKSPNLSQFINATGPTGTPAFRTLVTILKVRSTSIDGPRPLGGGIAGGAVLEPDFTTNARLFVLNGGIAHVDTGLAVATGNYVFCGISWNSGNWIDAYVYDYTTLVGASARITYTTPLSSSDGQMFLGTPALSTPNATDGLLYMAMIDHAQWSITDLTSLAAAPFAMFGATTATVAFAGVPAVTGALGVTALTGGQVALAGHPALTASLTANAILPAAGTVALVGSVPTFASLTATTGTGLTPAYFQHYILGRRGD